MEYAEALKKVQSQKPKENYLVIKLDYNTRLVLPYKDGIVFLEACKNAEQILNPHLEPRIVGVQQAFSTEIMSADEYQAHKIAALLQISVSEAKEMAEKL